MSSYLSFRDEGLTVPSPTHYIWQARREAARGCWCSLDRVPRSPLCPRPAPFNSRLLRPSFCFSGDSVKSYSLTAQTFTCLRTRTFSSTSSDHFCCLLQSEQSWLFQRFLTDPLLEAPRSVQGHAGWGTKICYHVQTSGS